MAENKENELFSKAASEFAARITREARTLKEEYKELLSNELLRPYLDRLEKLQTFKALLNKAVEEYMVVLAKLKSPRSPDTIISILNGLQPSIEELRSLYLLDAGFQNRLILPVEHKVAVQHNHVPAQHRAREVELPDAGDQVPEALRPAEVDGDERQAHQDCGHGEQLAEDHEVVQVLVVVDVDRDHEHHGRGGDADEEGEVGDVDAPRDVVGHARNREAVHELAGIGVEAQGADGGKGTDPEEIAPVALKQAGETPADKP